MNTYSIDCVDGKNVSISMGPGDDAVTVLSQIYDEFGIEPEDAMNCAVSHLTSANLTFETCPDDLLNMIFAFWSGCCAVKSLN
jgi:hypothetical protein